MTELSLQAKKDSTQLSVQNLCIAAFFMAIVVILSSFGVPVPGGHLYLNDIAIVAGALLLDPVSAFLVGGFGSFLGDMLFYPAPMFVSLITHGLQAVVISLIAKKSHKLPNIALAVTLGAIIMVVGYTLGRAFIYSTPAYAIIKLPFQILQAVVGAIVGPILIYKSGIRKVYLRLFQ